MFSYSQDGQAQGQGTAASVAEAASAIWWVADPAKGRPQPARLVQAEAGALRVLARDLAYAAKVARVRRQQARLRRHLSARGWQAYLRLEEAEIERWSYAIERVARWAASSRRRPRPR